MFKSFITGCAVVSLFTTGALLGFANQAEPAPPHARLPDRGSIQQAPGSDLAGVETAVTTIMYAVWYDITIRYAVAVNAAKINEQARLDEEARAQEVAEAAPPQSVQSQAAASAPSEGNTPCSIPSYICQRESGFNIRAENPTSTASGKYQFLDSTWNNYGGYPRASDAPEEVQDAAAAELWADGAGCSHWSAC